MASRDNAVAFLVVAFLLSSGALAVADFDFFYYVLSWPGSYCTASSEGCCRPTTGDPELDFFVYGLYSASDNGTILSSCNASRFLVNAVADVIGDMYSYMPSIKCPSNNGKEKWESLWLTYGGCSNLTQNKYFKTCLTLRSTINLLSRLRRLGFPPAEGKVYSRGLVQAAIDDAVGNETMLRCNHDLEGKAQLWQVWACMDKSGAFIKCPVYPDSSCSDSIYFPPFTLEMLKSSPEEDQLQQQFNPIEMLTSLNEA